MEKIYEAISEAIRQPHNIAVFVAGAVIFGIYKLITVHYPKWQEAERLKEEANNLSKDARNKEHNSNQEKIFGMMASAVNDLKIGIKDDFCDVKNKLGEMDARCQSRMNGKIKVEA